MTAMKRLQHVWICTFLALMLVAGTSALGATVADVAGDWVDAATLPPGWSYLQSDAATGGTETALTPSTAIGNAGGTGFGGGGNFQMAGVLGDNADGGEYEIFGDGQANHGGVLGTDLLIHPHNDLDYVIVRYTLGAAGEATIVGGFHGTSGGRTGAVYHNGTQLYVSADTTPDRATSGAFNETATVEAGDTISFVLDSGNNYGGDETSLRATIDLQHFVDITNASATVANAVGTTDIGGTLDDIVGTMSWSNDLTGANGALAATSPWQISNVGLGVGDNTITVTGTNAAGAEAGDTVTITRSPQRQILGLYTFEGASPAAFNDVSGQGLNPTTIGSATLNASGYEDQAASFAASTAISIPLNINPSVNPTMTIGAWVRPTDDSNRGVFGHDNGGWDRGLDLMGTWRTTGGSNHDSGIQENLADWQFVAVRYSGATGQEVKLFVDTDTYSRTLTAGSGAANMVIGAYTVASVHPFHGRIDSFFIFDDALTDAEIEIIRLNGLSGIQDVGRLLVVDATNANAAVANAVTTTSIGGTNENIVGTMSWTNSLTSANGTFSATTPWLISGIGLDVGDNVITVTGTNATGLVTSDRVTLTRSGIPFVDVTNANATVSYTVTTTDVGGTNSSGVVGTMSWVNSLTGESGTFPAATTWQISGVTLGVGDNVITVTGANAVGAESSDSVTLTRSAPQILALYTFEGASPAAFNDVSGQGLNPTTIGSATLNASGYEDQAASFAASTAISIPLNINPSVNPTLTIGAWVRPTDDSNRGVFGHDNGGWDRGLDLMGTWRTTGGSNYDSGIQENLADWQFVAVRYSGATGQEVKLFVDTDTYSRTLTAGSGAANMVIGAYTAASVHPFHGRIDNFFIFDDALSDAEIETIRQNGLVGIQDVGRLLVLDVTNENDTVAYDISTADIGGTQESIVGTMSWTNSLTTANGTFSATTPWLISSVALGVGDNVITVTGTNVGGLVTSDSVTIARLDQLQPAVDVTNANDTVVYEVTTTSIGGTNNANVVGDMSWTNSLTGADGTLSPGAPDWQVNGIALGVGDNVITVYASNATDTVVNDSVTITREPLPFVDVTNANDTVTDLVTTYDIGGTNNVAVVGAMRWTNSLTGANGTIAASSSWSLTGIGLDFGENVITVTGTNGSGTVASDSVTITRWSRPNWIDTDFTEATFFDIGLARDIPNPALATITLDDPNDRLVFTTTGNTDMWGTRNNAPIGYILKPGGPHWYMEAELELASTGSGQVFGFTVYADTDGARPDFTYSLDLWGGVGSALINLQGLGDNNPLVNVSAGGATRVILRVEAEDDGGGPGVARYTLKYDLLGGAGMQTLTTYDSSFSNARVGLAMKTGNTGRTGYVHNLRIAGLPAVDVTTANDTVAYEVTASDVAGTHNANVVGMMSWTNSLTGMDGTVSAGSPWLISGIDLDVGDNVITVTGTNAVGEAESDNVTITRLELTPPVVDVTNANDTVENAITTTSIGGTNNTYAVGTMTWTNSLTGANGTLSPGAPTWQINSIALDVGANVITVTGTNALGVSGSDSVTITRKDLQQPAVDVTNANNTVVYEVTTYDIGGTNNANVAGTMSWTNSLTGADGTLAPGAPTWQINGIALAVGENVIRVYASNDTGTVVSDNVTITREPLPYVDVTNANDTVLSGVTTTDIGGTNNNAVVGTMSWTNSLTGANGTVAASSSWSISAIGLGVGENVITVSGTNGSGTVASDSVTVTRLSVSGTPLLGLYPFEGVSPAAFDDVSGQGLHPTDVGTGVLDALGYENQAASFSGTQIPIDIPIDISPGVNPTLTIGTWAKPDTIGQRGVFGHDNGGWDRLLGAGGFSADNWKYPGGSEINSGIPVTAGAWQFVAVAYNGTTSAKIYVDENSHVSAPHSAGAGDSVMAIGAINAGGTWKYDGLLDNFFIFGETLNDQQVETIRLGGLSGILEVAGLLLVDMTNENATVAYEVPTTNIRGAHIGVVGTMSWTNSLTGSNGTFAAASPWQVSDVDLDVGINVITVTGTNATGVEAGDSVTITRLDLTPPVVDITNANDIVANAITSYDIGGTNNTYAVGTMTWTNSLTGANGTLSSGAPTWQINGIALDIGNNVVTVTGTNALGVSDSDSVSIFRQAVAQPYVTVTNVDETVVNEVASTSVGGTNNANVVGTMSWTNGLTGGNGTLSAGAPGWQINGIALGVGGNVITVSGTNAVGVVNSDSVTITREPPPFVDVTNAPAGVAHTVTTTSIGGTNNTAVVGTVSWTNSLTGGSGTLSAASPWQISGVAVEFGDNVITVTGTNAVGTAGSDSVTITRLRPQVLAIYTFEGASPAAFNDVSGEGLDPTDVGTGTLYFSGYEGQAASFSGTHTPISVPIDIDPNSNPTLTIGMWAKPDTVGQRGLFGQDNGGWDRGLIAGGNSGSNWRYPGGTDHSSGIGVSVGTWQFVAVAYNGTTSAKIYVDAASHVTAPHNAGNGATVMGIGALNTGGTWKYDGLIDNFFIFGETLTDAEIETIRLNGLAGVREVAGLPVVDVTNVNAIVNPEVATTNIVGTQVNVVGMMTWTNSLTTSNGTFAATSPWQISDMGLGIGTNVITVAGTNRTGSAASDSVTITRVAPPTLFILR